MKLAKLFKNKEIVVSADEVLAGKYDRKLEFVDVDEEFKVTFVKAAKANGGPYFRLYFSLKDYNSWSQDKKDRYEIVKNMRFFEETPWHKEWKKMFAKYGTISEKYFKAFESEKEKGRYADSYYERTNTVIEFQDNLQRILGNSITERNLSFSYNKMLEIC